MTAPVELFSDRPAGRDPLVTAQVTFPPDTVGTHEYTSPTYASGIVPVTIMGVVHGDRADDNTVVVVVAAIATGAAVVVVTTAAVVVVAAAVVVVAGAAVVVVTTAAVVVVAPAVVVVATDEMLKIHSTGAAGAYPLPPSCVAFTWHAPTPMTVMVVPLTVHTSGVNETSVTERVGEAEVVAPDAMTMFVPDQVRFPGSANVIVCGVSEETMNVWGTSVAAP